MASKIEFGSALHALGDLAKDPRIASALDDKAKFIDWSVIFKSWNTFSSGEKPMIGLAETLYRGNASEIPFDFAALLTDVDGPTWKRALEALTLRRGIDDEEGLTVLPGQWQG